MKQTVKRWTQGKTWLLAALVLLIAAGCSEPYTFFGTQYSPPQSAADFVGTNWDGSPFRLSDQQGNVVLLFFGYTFCPDICPLTLGGITQVFTQLGDDAAGVRAVFVSVDPARDSPERLAAYVPAFNPAFLGIHIDEDELTAVKQAYGVLAEQRKTDDQSSIDYLIDHTAWIYVIDKKGMVRVAFGHDSPPAEIAADVAHLLNE